MSKVKNALTKYFSYPDHREAIYDFIRVFACIGVVGIHTTPPIQTPANAFLFAFFRTAMPLFFVMSGALLLGGEEKPSDEKLGLFYLKRIESVVLPFLIYICFWGCWVDTWHSIPQIVSLEELSSMIRLIPTVLYENLTGPHIAHFWFMYELIGLYLISPFLKKGLHAFSASFLKKLLLVILIVMSVATYLPMLGISLYFTNYFAAWVIYYILGYILTRKEMERTYPVLAVVGAIAFVFMVIWQYYHPDLEVTQFYHLQPHMMLCTAGIFSLCMLLKEKLTFSKKINWVMMHLGKYCFCVYAIHNAFLWNYQALYPEYGQRASTTILVVLAVYGKALLFAIVFDNLITFNLQRLFRLVVKLISLPCRRRNDRMKR